MTDLTPRQLDVARLVAQGRSYLEVARALGMARNTVKSHVASIALKLDNPDQLPAKTLVTLWAAHRIWTEAQPLLKKAG